MGKSSGKDLLRTCLAKFDKAAELDSYICYKYGNKPCIDDYQNDHANAILTESDLKQIRAGVPAVVKCFVKSKIYAGWHASVGAGSGKYQIDTSFLKDFEHDAEQDYRVIITGSKDDEKVYLFRKESGIVKFFEEILNLENREKPN